MGGNFNYSGIGVKENNLTDPVQPTIFIKSEFDNDDKLENKDDTGYVGGASTKLGEVRVKADGTVKLKDSLRWKEGLEQFLFFMFGGNRVGVPSTVTGEDGLFVYNFGDSENMPYLTILQGYNNSTNSELKPVLYDNAIMDSFKLGLSDGGEITVELEFLNDYPLYNCVPVDPTRTYAPQSLIVSKANVVIGVGDVGCADSELIMTDCIQSMDIEFKQNCESKNCYAGEFGKNNLVRGDLSSSVKYKMDLNKNNSTLETKIATGTKEGKKVREQIYEQKVVLFIDGYITSTDSKTSMRLEIPIISLSPAKRSKTEDTIEVEGNTIMELATGQMVNIRVASELSEIQTSNQTYVVD
jgi:hypothetical protein